MENTAPRRNIKFWVLLLHSSSDRQVMDGEGNVTSTAKEKRWKQV